MVKYLCVAEKPSISKSISQILSGGQFQTRNARHPAWIKNYDFTYRMPNVNGFTQFTVTAVAGHLMCSDFEAELKSWKSCDPFVLFDAPINTFVNPDPNQKGIEANLIAEAKKATHLMIWTDCDREGEHIGHEVAQICRKANNRIIVKRARFSAIIAAQINNACRNPVDLDMRQANAVAARMDLDLRVGAAFTRTQTLSLQARFDALAENIISYGPCQFPTLGFVVDQYERVQSFVSEPFWYLYLSLERDEATVNFTWRRGRLFDEAVVEMLLEMCKHEGEAEVVRRQTKPTQKWKPLPLTTVELQKTGSRLLRMTPKKILDISDSLYQKGFLSYPRTETDQFDKDFDFREMIEKHVGDPSWGAFAQNLMGAGFERPRNGQKNDKAHPPIHPTAHVTNLAGDDKKVYDLVTRRFLACCSKNARGMESTVEVKMAEEIFSATGLIVTERNYLDVYIYDKWNGHILPQFEDGEKFVPTTLESREGATTRPNLLTEADLVSLMDKNGIGTDATIAEHIAKIIEREYVMKQPVGGVEYLLPSTLGIGLVDGYNAIGFDKSLSKPHLRRLTEHRMQQICDGLKTKQEVINETIEEYREMYVKTKQEMNTFVGSVRRYLEGDGANGGNGGGDSDDDDNDNGGGGGNNGAGGGGNARGRGRGRGVAVDRGRGRGRGADPAPRGGRGRGAAPRGRGQGQGQQRQNLPDSDSDDDNGPPRGGGANRVAVRAPARQQDEDEDEFDAMLADEDDDVKDEYARPPPAPVQIPQCDCGDQASERSVTKDNENKGRKFYSCPKGIDDGCGFFAWADDNGGGAGRQKKRPLQGNGNAAPARRRGPPNHDDDEEVERRCECDMTAALRTVTKEGPNTGRKFFVCPNVSKTAQCKYFAWEDENPGAGGKGMGGGGAGGGGKGQGECYLCHQDDHWAKDCPTKANRAGGGGGNGNENNLSCFKCGEQGHWSNQCPNPGGGGPPAKSRGRGRGRGASSTRAAKRGGSRGRGTRGRAAKQKQLIDWEE